MKKVILICCIMLAILTVGVVSASDANATSDSLMIDDEYSIMEKSSDESLKITNNSEILSDGNSSGTFSDLNEIIVNSAKNSEIKLDKDYVFSNTTDNSFINGIGINKRLTINGQGHKIDGMNMSRIFVVTANAVSLKNINFANSISNTSAGTIDWRGERGEIHDCTFENSTGIDVGAVYGEKMKISNSSFSNCYAIYKGNSGSGALYLFDSEVFDCSFVNCRSSGYECGAIWMSNFNISRCSFTNCSSPGSGALYIFGKGVLSHCGFKNCFADGVGVLTLGSDSSSIFNCTFINCHSSGYAGVLDISGSDFNISDCSFINCSAVHAGGAIVFHGNGTLSNSRFINCFSAEGGSAIYTFDEIIIGIENCEFRDCYSNGTAGATIWGGPYKGSVHNSRFINCHTTGGGGAMWVSNYNISNSSFINCAASGAGAVACDKNVTLFKCDFIDCHAIVAGALDMGTDCFASDCSFTNCTADEKGGAICMSLMNTKIEDCNFIKCIADENGGAIAILQMDATVDGCKFEKCEADYGGAIFIDNDNAIIRNSEFIDNNAFENGGAIFSGYYGLVENSTFKANRAYKGNSIWTNRSDLKIKSNRFMLATNENRQDIIYSIPLKDIRNENEVYNGDRLVIVPDIDITYKDIVFGENESVNVALPDDATGKITLTLKNEGKIIKTVTYDLNQGKTGETYSNLGLGIYDIIIDYVGDSNYYDNSKNVTFAVRPNVNITQNVVIGGKVEITIDLVGATGKVFLNIDGKAEDVKEITDDKVTFTIDTEKLAARNHTVTFSYNGDSFDENVFNNVDSNTPYEYDLYIQPMNITVKDKVSSKDAGVIAIELPDDAEGTVEVFVNDVYYGVVDIVKGISSLDLSSFKNGKYVITWEYSGDDKYDNFTHKSTLTINRKIVGGNCVVIYSSNAKYSVKVYNEGKLAAGINVTFVIGGKTYANVKTDKKGIASVVIKKNPGSYKITSKALGISITKKLTVAHIVTLKAIKVKKSARSLVLTATLKKVNKRYVVGKWITFKFNGKTLKAKTNKKGIAKVTVKKVVLNKLKVGKKVTYQAAYGKDTIKRTAKVIR